MAVVKSNRLAGRQDKACQPSRIWLSKDLRSISEPGRDGLFWTWEECLMALAHRFNSFINSRECTWHARHAGAHSTGSLAACSRHSYPNMESSSAAVKKKLPYNSDMYHELWWNRQRSRKPSSGILYSRQTSLGGVPNPPSQQQRPVFCTACWFILTRRCSLISLLYLSLLVKHLLDINHCHPCWCNPIIGCITPRIVAFFVDLLLKECHTTYIAMDQPWYPTVHIEITPIGLLYWCPSHHSYGKSQVLQAETQEFDRIWVVCISGK